MRVKGRVTTGTWCASDSGMQFGSGSRSKHDVYECGCVRACKCGQIRKWEFLIALQRWEVVVEDCDGGAPRRAMNFAKLAELRVQSRGQRR